MSTLSGTFAGVWASTLDDNYRPYADYRHGGIHRATFDLLSSAWNTSITATNYSYAGGHQSYSSDYQQITASISYLDRWTFSFSAIPNMVRYWTPGTNSPGNPTAPAATRRTTPKPQGSGSSARSVRDRRSRLLPVSLETTARQASALVMPTATWASPMSGTIWRLDVGYFLTQKADRAAAFPLSHRQRPRCRHVSWRF